VVWTDLPSTFKPFNFEKALDHLRKLNGEELDRAEIYVRKTPEQIRTKLRTTVEKEFGWTYIKNE